MCTWLSSVTPGPGTAPGTGRPVFGINEKINYNLSPSGPPSHSPTPGICSSMVTQTCLKAMGSLFQKLKVSVTNLVMQTQGAKE